MSNFYTIEDLSEFKDAISNGAVGNVNGLCGRIVRGSSPEEFETLTDDLSRKLVMLMGADGLEQMLEKPDDYEKLLAIGWEHKDVEYYIDLGKEFKLVVFNESAAKLADWNSAIEAVIDVYPDIADKLHANLELLKTVSYAEIEASAGYTFHEVRKNGDSDPRFMTYDRYKKSSGNLVETRAFLYLSIHLRELYSGDGYTYTPEGERGLKEYIIPNMSLKDLDEYLLLDLNATLPKSNTKASKGANTMSTFEKTVSKFMPSFFDPSKINQFYSADLNAARKEGYELSKKLDLKKKENRALVMIDDQWDFTEKGRLPVTGMFGDVERLINRIILGVHETRYSNFVMSIDTHPVYAVHNDLWWKGTNGDIIDASMPKLLVLVDEKEGVFEEFDVMTETGTKNYFKPRFGGENKDKTINYGKYLLENGVVWAEKGIWVFTVHCRANTDGAMLVPALAEIIEWAAAALMIEPSCMYKGMIPHVDWFGPYHPNMLVEDHPNGGWQVEHLSITEKSDEVEFTGEAYDFCFRGGVSQNIQYYTDVLKRPEILQKFKFIRDTTSPIIDGNPATPIFEQSMKDNGIIQISHDTPFTKL